MDTIYRVALPNGQLDNRYCGYSKKMEDLMKKALVLLLATLFLVVAVGATYAAETTFNGQYQIRAWSNWNFEKKPDHPDSRNGLYTGYFDQRFRLTITHTRSDFLKAVVQLDLVEDTWGQQRNFRMNNAYTKLTGKEWKMTNGFVRKAYIEFKVPSIGTFTIGKQPVVLGYGLAFSDSWGRLDGLKWANKWGPLAVSAMYFKWDDNIENTGAYADEVLNRDTDIWLLDLVYTPNQDNTIELFGGYVNMRAGIPPSHLFNTIWKFGDKGDLAQTNLGLVGIAYTGEIADMITLKGEFDYLFGRANLENWGPAFTDEGWFSGYNLYLDASYHNDLLRVGMAFVMGSGQTEHGYTAAHYNVNYITADKFSFGNIIAGGSAGGGLNDSWNSGIGFCNDIENLTAAKLYFEIYPMEKLSLNAAVIWARWTEPFGNNSMYHNHPMDFYNSDTDYPGKYGTKTDLGWELDLGFKYQIMEGLSYTFAGGVLFTGDSFNYNTVGGDNKDWGPIWMISNVLTYDF
jgi:hypothetical protein